MNKKQAVALTKRLGLPESNLLDIGEGMWTFSSPIRVTPDVALEWLDEYNTDNRQTKSRNIDRMKTDLNNGWWHVTHQGIAFRDEQSPDGLPILGDGQNRLQAIVSSGQAASIRVFFGLTKTAMLAIDSGSPRTPKDQLTLQGIQNVHSEHLSTLRFFLGGKKGEANRGNEASKNDYAKWQDELNFVFSSIPKKRNTRITAAVRAVIMRAYLNHKNEPEKVNRLKKFCIYLANGMGDGPGTGSKDKLVANFRDKLKDQNYGGQGRKILYAATEKVIYHILFEPESAKLPKHLDEVE